MNLYERLKKATIEEMAESFWIVVEPIFRNATEETKERAKSAIMDYLLREIDEK